MRRIIICVAAVVASCADAPAALEPIRSQGTARSVLIGVVRPSNRKETLVMPAACGTKT